MNDIRLWLVLIGGGLITFGLRCSFIALVDHLTLGPRVRQALRYVPVAVFSAMACPPVVVQAGVWAGPASPRVWAAMVAVLVAWRSRNVLYTVGAGMATLGVAALIAHATA
ncbi:AzlD domain-containing protein [Salinisphaera sp. T31B1]|uniref:AzlD domain-containing protein n=1 Tax=Salinisphaera sp. T31B1 TaxID=727963 RepID=UPI0033407E1B